MENASKALIIAGAILISILLISVGIMVMRAASRPAEDVEGRMRAISAQMFNEQFTGYTGVQTSASIKALMTAIVSSNGEYDFAKIQVFPTNFAGGNGSNPVAPGEIQGRVSASKNYRVILDYDSQGYVNIVKIEETNK